jgi:hypothetical protein
VCEDLVSSSPYTCPNSQRLGGGGLAPCEAFDCQCTAKVRCPPGKKVGSCSCYNSNPRTITPRPHGEYEGPEVKTASYGPALGRLPWVLSASFANEVIPGEVGTDGECNCAWVNTMLLVSVPGVGRPALFGWGCCCAATVWCAPHFCP